MRIDEIGVFQKVSGNNFATIATQSGIYGMVLANGWAHVIGPGVNGQAFEVPQAHIARLGVINGELVIDYTAFLGHMPGTENDDPDRPWRRGYTAIKCGAQVGAIETAVVQTGPPGSPGAKGDRGDRGNDGKPGTAGAPGQKGGDAKVDDETMRKLGDVVAERVFSLPPAADHFGLPAYVQYGTRFQEMIAVMVHQALMQRIFMAGDEGLANLVKSGWKSKVQ